MSKNKLTAIPRAPRQPPATALDDWVRDGGQAGADAPKPVIIKAAVSPELRRRLRHAAIEHDTTVADILREQAERWLAEQGS